LPLPPLRHPYKNTIALLRWTRNSHEGREKYRERGKGMLSLSLRGREGVTLIAFPKE
jgi:hypothetical protein